MSTADFYAQVAGTLQDIRAAGLWKQERLIASPQSALVRLADGRELINLCANNYLGLANHPRLLAAAAETLNRRGYGMASVRFICGTQDLHRELEQRLARYLGTEDAILYAAAFDANGGLFETLLDDKDAVISDELNHASIIDGIRLCKAQRYRFRHNDLEDLERALREARAAGARHVLVFSDGVFSMDGTIAALDRMRDLCDAHGALLGIDECHATGILGATGRGTHEHRDVYGRIDIITGTLGKALGGASGGFTAARRGVIELLRQRSRPYLFSNALMPAIAGASLAALELLESEHGLRHTLHANALRFRSALTAAGYRLPPGEHPIVPIMVGEAERAQALSQRLYDLGVYAVGFYFPVVPKGKARVRVQLSAALDGPMLERAVAAFVQAGRELGLLSGAADAAGGTAA